VICPKCSHRFQLADPNEEVLDDLEVIEDEDDFEEKEVRRRPPRPKKREEKLDDLEVVEDEDEEPPPRRPPRRKKRKKKRSADFDLLDAIPLSYNAQCNIGIVVGLLIHFAGFGIQKLEGFFFLLGLAVWLVGDIFFVWGYCAYARMKGHSAWLGFLGILGLPGLLVLRLLPHRNAD
jgi:hypothetical protein